LCLILGSILVPPIVLTTVNRKKTLGIISLLLCCLAFYNFFEISVISGLVLYFITMNFSVFYVVKKLRNDQFLYFGQFSIALVIIYFISLISSIYTFDSRINEVKPVFVSTENLVRGKLLFAQCLACHRLNNDNFVGPSLAKVYGRKAGAVANYNYSNGMKKADFVWSEESLLKFLTNQNDTVPGTRMIISPLEKGDILDMIAYLKTK